MKSELIEAEHLIDAQANCIDDKRSSEILALIIEVLSPLIKERIPRALWLKSKLPNLGETTNFSGNEFDVEYEKLVEEAAIGGCAEAQYTYGCALYDKNKQSEALKFYEKSASQDYAPAQWCLGIDTISGIGVEKNESLGIFYVRLAAEAKYEYAVAYLLDSIKKEWHGLKAEASEVSKWENILAGLKNDS